jgi:hypothetical protein
MVPPDRRLESLRSRLEPERLEPERLEPERLEPERLERPPPALVPRRHLASLDAAKRLHHSRTTRPRAPAHSPRCRLAATAGSFAPWSSLCHETETRQGSPITNPLRDDSNLAAPAASLDASRWGAPRGALLFRRARGATSRVFIQHAASPEFTIQRGSRHIGTGATVSLAWSNWLSPIHGR